MAIIQGQRLRFEIDHEINGCTVQYDFGASGTSGLCNNKTFSLQHAQKFSQSHGRPDTMTAVPLQPFSRSPAGSGGRAAVGGDVGS
jgi:hypothetical protein